LIKPIAGPGDVGGVALIEALVAILIFSFGILGFIGLQAMTTQSTSMSKTRIDASLVASQRIAELWGQDLTKINDIPDETDVDVSKFLPDGKRSMTIDNNKVTVTVTWRMPSETERQTYTTVAMVIGQ
jgi:type IV pilus assembly protein PilV